MILVVCMCLSMMPVTGLAAAQSGNSAPSGAVPEPTSEKEETATTAPTQAENTTPSDTAPTVAESSAPAVTPTQPEPTETTAATENVLPKWEYLIPGNSAFNTQSVKQLIPETAIPVTAKTTAWGQGQGAAWYVADKTMKINERITVTGDVNLVLCDGVHLHAEQGITVAAGNSLTIWAQSDGEHMGALSANGRAAGAGIGGLSGLNGANGGTAGSVIIQGGTITAMGGSAAGIGGGAGAHSNMALRSGTTGGAGGNGGVITVNGGSVTATSTGAAGIGGGAGGNGASGNTSCDGGMGGHGGMLNVYGGTLKAIGGMGGAGIGGGAGGMGNKGGVGGDAAVVTIGGGTVQASGNNGAGIGSGMGGNGKTLGQQGRGSSTRIYGGTTVATGNRGAGIGGTDAITVISGGAVTASSKNDFGIAGKFQTQENGRPGSGAVFADSIQDQSGKEAQSWSGMIFEKGQGTTFGDMMVEQDLTIPRNHVLQNKYKLTVAPGVKMQVEGTIHNEGAIENFGIISGHGRIEGKGACHTTGAAVENLRVDGMPPKLAYNGLDLSKYLENVKLIERICGNEFEVSGWTRSFQKERNGVYSNVREIVDAGKYQIVFTNQENGKTKAEQFQVYPSDTAFESVESYLDSRKTDTFTYGDIITIKVKPKVPVRTYAASGTGVAQPAEKQVALYYMDRQLGNPVNLGSDGYFTLTYHTMDKMIPAAETDSQYAHLEIRFFGGSNFGDGNKGVVSTVVPVNISKRALSAEVKEKQAKVYDGTAEVSGVELTNITNLVPGDSVKAVAEGVLSGPDVDGGKLKTFTAEHVVLSGKTAAFYTMPSKNVTGSLQIEKAEISQVQVQVEAPVPGGTPMTEFTGENFTGKIYWKGQMKNDLFHFSTVYTANVTLKPDGNHTFTRSTDVTGLEGKKAESDGTITGIVRFPVTPQAKILTANLPEEFIFEDEYKDVRAALAALPQTMAITAEDGTETLQLTWKFNPEATGKTTYDPGLTTSNYFDWTAEPGALDPNDYAMSGTIKVSNVDVHKPHHETSDQTVKYDGSAVDLSSVGLFRLDKNAGKAAYTLEAGGTGSGTVEGNLLHVTGAGTFQIKVHTDPQGLYGAGTARATLTVNPQGLVIQLKDQDIQYGESIRGTSSRDALDMVVSVTGLADGHKLSEITLSTQDRDVTNQGRITAVNPKIMSGSEDLTGCYEISYTGGNLIIRPVAPSLIAPAGVSGLVYNGQDQALVKNGSTADGTMLYSVNGGTWSQEIPTGLRAGTYTVSFKVEGDKNHTTTNGTELAPITIGRKNVTLTPKEQTVPYGSSLSSTSGDVECALMQGDTLENIELIPSTHQITYNGTIMVNGYRIMRGSADVTDCYNVTTRFGKLQITRSAPECKLPEVNRNLTYNAGLQDLIQAGSSSHGTFLYRLGDEGQWSPVVPQAKDADTYVVYYKFQPDENHTAIAETRMAPVSIRPKVVSKPAVTLERLVYVYSGMAYCPKVIAVKDGSQLIPDSEYSVSYRSNVEASENGAKVIITDKPGGNYQISSTTQTFSITKNDSKLTEIQISSNHVTYGDVFAVSFVPRMLNDSSLLASVRAEIPNERVAELWLGDAKVAAIRNVGANGMATFIVNTADKTIPASAFDGQLHEFTIRWGGDKNLKESAGKVFASLHKLEITASLAAGQTKPYDGANTFTGASLELNSVLKDDDVIGTADGILTGNSVNDVGWGAQSTDIKLSGTHKDYYRLTTENVSGTYSITPREVELQWENLTQDYNGKELVPTVKLGNLVKGDRVSAQVTVIGSPVNAGTYTAVAQNLDDFNYKLPDVNYTDFTIRRIDPEYQIPTAQTLTYNGDYQALLSAENSGSTTQGQIRYSDKKNGVYTQTVPKGKDADTYTVWYKVIGDRNHSDVEPKPVEVIIAPKSISGAEVNLGPALIYNAKEQEQTVVSVMIDGLQATCEIENNKGKDAKVYTLTANGVENFTGTVRKQFTIAKYTVTVEPVPGQNKIYGEDEPKYEYQANMLGKDKLEGQLTRIAGKNVGKYSFDLGNLHNENYILELDQTYQFEILPKELTAEITIADKQYDGTDKATIGSVKFDGLVGNDQVALSGGNPTFATWEVGEDIPVILTEFTLTGPDAGNYVLIQPDPVTGNIINDFYPQNGGEYLLSGEGWLREPLIITAQTGYQLCPANSSEAAWGHTLIGDVVGANSSLSFFVKNTKTGAISNEVVVKYQLDNIPPTGKATLDKLTSWDNFLNTITFDTVYKDSQRLLVDAEDTLSGVERIDAVLMDRPLTQAEVEALPEGQWQPVSKSTVVRAVDQERFVFYVRLMDKAGNIAYISTDGAEFDTRAPMIKGVRNGETYYTTRKIQVIDKNLDTVILNSQSRTEAILIKPVEEKTVYTIEAADRAGNKTTMTFYMEPLAETIQPLTEPKLSNVTQKHQSLLEEQARRAGILLNNPYLSDEERNQLNLLKEQAQSLLDRIADADAAYHTEAVVKTENVTDKTVTLADKEAISKAWNDLDQAVLTYGDNYTDGQKQEIQKMINRLSQAMKSVERVEFVLREVGRLPSEVQPDDELNEHIFLTAQAAYKDLNNHEKEMAGPEVEQILEKVQADLVNYQITHGNGATVGPDNFNDLIIIANGNYKKLEKIVIDKKTVELGNYTVASGSTIVTLKNQFLKELEDQEHTIVFAYTDGEVTGSFVTQKEIPAESTVPSENVPTPSPNPNNPVKPDVSPTLPYPTEKPVTKPTTPPPPPETPQTGDLANPAVWSGLLILAAAGAFLIFLKKNKRK